MKAKVVNLEKEKSFEPIKLEITIESYDELCDLYHRANAPVAYINERASFYIAKNPALYSEGLYSVLKAELIKYNKSNN